MFNRFVSMGNFIIIRRIATAQCQKITLFGRYDHLDRFPSEVYLYFIEKPVNIYFFANIKFMRSWEMVL